MRCGVETLGKQVFCDDCLAFMEKYPVAPGTAVHLPLRKNAEESKKNARKRRELTPEEQLLQMKQLVRWLAGALAAAVIAAAILGTALFLSLTDSESDLPQGRNYTSESA
jgi:hypothetical protein